VARNLNIVQEKFMRKLAPPIIFLHAFSHHWTKGRIVGDINSGVTATFFVTLKYMLVTKKS